MRHDKPRCGVLRRAKPVVAKEKITAAMTTSTTKPVSSAQSKSTSTKPAAAKPTQPKPVSASSSKASSSAKEKTVSLGFSIQVSSKKNAKQVSFRQHHRGNGKIHHRWTQTKNPLSANLWLISQSRKKQKVCE